MVAIVPDEDTWAGFDVTTLTTGPWNFDFQYMSKEDLEVTVDNVVVPINDWNLTPGSVVTAGGYDGGSFSLDVAVEDARVVIARKSVIERDANLSGSNLTFQNINALLNRYAYSLQELKRDIARALLANYGQSGDVVDPDDIEAVAAIAAEIANVSGIDAEILILAGLAAEITAIAALGVADLEAIAAGLAAKADQATTYTKDEVDAIAATKLNGAIAATYAAARLLTGIALGGIVHVRGRAAAEDGGQGKFRVVASADVDDGGMVLVMADGQRLKRMSPKFKTSYWVAGDGTTDDTVAAQSWATAVRAAATAGSCIAVIDRKVAVATQINLNDWGATGKLDLRTEGSGEFLVHSSAASLFFPLNVSGGGISGTPTTITTNVAEWASAVIVASAAGLAVGDYVYFDHVNGTTTHRGMTNRIAAIAGTTITLEEIIPFSINVSLGTTVFRKILLQPGLKIRDYKATGDRTTTAKGAAGIICQYLLNPKIKGVETSGFVSNGAVFQYFYTGTIQDVYDEQSGDLGVGASLATDGLTRVDCANWKSIESNGYAGLFARSAHCTYSRITGRDCVGRGLEWYGSSGNLLNQILQDKSGATGISIVYGCQNNRGVGIQTTRATDQSFWSNGVGNTGNHWDAITAFGSVSGVDISISGSDSGCSFRGINRTATIDPNAPADTYFEYAQRDFVRAYYSANTALTTGANRVLVFDTEDSDPFGSYNNSTGLFTAGTSAMYRVTIQLNALSDFTGNNTIGLGGGQARNNKTTLIRDANQNLIYITNVWMRKGETMQPYINLGANVTINGQSDISLLMIEELGGVRGVAA